MAQQSTVALNKRESASTENLDWEIIQSGRSTSAHVLHDLCNGLRAEEVVELILGVAQLLALASRDRAEGTARFRDVVLPPVEQQLGKVLSPPRIDMRLLHQEDPGFVFDALDGARHEAAQALGQLEENVEVALVGSILCLPSDATDLGVPVLAQALLLPHGVSLQRT